MDLLSMDDIGYFNFMKQEEEKQEKVNAENKNDLVGEQPTTNTEKNFKK